MRYQGKVSNWNDDKGFGFVQPNGGGDKSFIHIKSFVSRGRRPVDGDIITYQQVKDSAGRFKAEKIEFPRQGKGVSSTKPNTRRFGLVVTILFCLSLIVLTVIGELPLILFIAYSVLSLLTFITYAIDKSAARTGRWRTKESTLHLFALLGGWPGAFYAQNRLRHKSSKSEFKAVFWLTVIINVSGLVWLLNNESIMGMMPSLANILPW